MSKTDKTNPWFVKQHYEKNFLKPVHDHRFHDCNLPPRPNPKHDRHMHWQGSFDRDCFWWPSYEFYRSRWARCGCYMCSRYAYDKTPAEIERRNRKRYCRDGWRDEY